MTTFLKLKLVFAAVLAFVGSELNLAQAQDKVVVIPLFLDAKPLEPFAPLPAATPPNDDYAISATTVIDNITGLEWQRIDENNTENWDNAGDYCAALSLDSKDNWRLPSVSELMSIVSYGNSGPAINEVAFPSTDTLGYWPATNESIDNGFSGAWRVNFEDGRISIASRNNSFHVRCVRSSRPIGPVLQDNNNGTVTDLATGLIWQQEDDNDSKKWAEAQSYCSNLALGNKNWRLPNVKELASIVDYRVSSRAIDDAMFPSTKSANYWSVSSYASDSAFAWRVYFDNGTVLSNDKTTSSCFVRCVH